ncbi:hypothetical protein BGC33_07795 [Bathymodiolus thermophilus thioautotrophic gill symbiont]|uniref:Uncharacterized protein n=1 Tax=Bathymodiolus thermophilus thioautotrophic gill symbiont TaxID=2360 RepID=A0A1J5TS15_9GAMM|nr:hypothetical protein BGC33_07795 [Bathymodiolus thermophilus thioautotrophic gill symbiont]
MIAWGLFGGLGKRSRKGFGSVAIQSLIFKGIKQKDIDFVSDNYEKYKAHINNIIPKLEVFENTNYPPYSAFSQDSKIFITDIDNLKTDATKVHKDLEGAYKRYRSGNGQSNNKPERKDFGTPVAFKNDPNDSTSDRRASPIFLHIHPIKESNSVQYVGVRLYLPAMDIKHPGLIQKFLEDGAIEIKNI